MSWALIGSTFIAAFAWLYQRAWERHQSRIQHYESFIELLPSLTVERWDAEGINRLIQLANKLWLTAPDDVLTEFNQFWDAVQENDPNREKQLGRLMLALRKDASFKAALFPRFFRTRVKPEQFKLRSAGAKPEGASP